MKIKLALATFVLTTAAAQAGEFVPATGFGTQYGDLGGKFMYREDNMAIYVGAGVGGAAVGFHIAPSASSQHVFPDHVIKIIWCILQASAVKA